MSFELNRTKFKKSFSSFSKRYKTCQNFTSVKKLIDLIIKKEKRHFVWNKFIATSCSLPQILKGLQWNPCIIFEMLLQNLKRNLCIESRRKIFHKYRFSPLPTLSFSHLLSWHFFTRSDRKKMATFHFPRLLKFPHFSFSGRFTYHEKFIIHKTENNPSHFVF